MDKKSDRKTQLRQMMDDLVEHHESLVQEVRDLQVEFTCAAREAVPVLYRTFGIRNEKTRLRVDWQRLEFSGKAGSRKAQPIRIDRGVGYNQAVKFMGKMDLAHVELFNRYEPRLAVIREMADLNADARTGIAKLLAAAEKHDL